MEKLAFAIIIIIIYISICSVIIVSEEELEYNYKEAVSKSLLYFEAQRSGRLPYNQRVSWRDHSALTDGLQQGVDLVGGYYDAGDHVKFGLPMAFTATMLSWGVIEFGQAINIVGAHEFHHALESIKWATDYFIKAHTSPNVLWVEVGDGDTDHYCWQRPEDMTTSRQAYKIDETNPGSDVAGETAAAMAAASIVFKEINPHYSHLLLHHARQLFEFADKYRGKYDESLKVVNKYYASVSGYTDELLWAAMWLYKATDNQHYLRYALLNAHSFGGITWSISEFSWDVKFAGLQLFAATQLLVNHEEEEDDQEQQHNTQILEEYQSKAEYYLCSCLNKNINGSNVERTGAGLLYVRQWNNMQYVSSATFLLTVYSNFLASTNQVLNCPQGVVTHQQIFNYVKYQVDYILGSNPLNISYLVGYGSKYPQRVHHRGASIVSFRQNKGFIGCTQGYDHWYASMEPNPNLLVGALVGGPDFQDSFTDHRGNYVQTEACTYNTAPLVGVFAKFNQLQTLQLASSK